MSHDDGWYDDIGRDDETQLNTSSKPSSIDYSAFKACSIYNNSGLTCGDKCLQNIGWCLADTAVSAPASCGPEGAKIRFMQFTVAHLV